MFEILTNTFSTQRCSNVAASSRARHVWNAVAAFEKTNTVQLPRVSFQSPRLGSHLHTYTPPPQMSSSAPQERFAVPIICLICLGHLLPLSSLECHSEVWLVSLEFLSPKTNYIELVYNKQICLRNAYWNSFKTTVLFICSIKSISCILVSR